MMMQTFVCLILLASGNLSGEGLQTFSDEISIEIPKQLSQHINVTEFQIDVEQPHSSYCQIFVRLNNWDNWPPLLLILFNHTSGKCSVVFAQQNGQVGVSGSVTYSKTQGLSVSTADDYHEKMRALAILVKARYDFYNTSVGRLGTIQNFTVPFMGCYNLTVKGAQGGRQNLRAVDGGKGALVGGHFNLTRGAQLRIVVGQAGIGTTRPNAPGLSHLDGTGGGGGTFVFTLTNQLLVASGGGGGGVLETNQNTSGQAGEQGGYSVYTNFPNNLGTGGIGGQGGNIGDPVGNGNDGGAGAGWLSAGASVRAGETYGGRPGQSLAGGFLGGEAPPDNNAAGLFASHGGFGGGGSGSPQQTPPPTEAFLWGSGGAGGGFSGGASGSCVHSGGGGGSHVSSLAVDSYGVTGGNSDAQGSASLTLIGEFC